MLDVLAVCRAVSYYLTELKTEKHLDGITAF